MSAPVGVGILGGADIAWRSTAAALAAGPGTRLVAVASRSAERAARFADRFGCAGLTSYDDLLARPDVAAVYVPLPTGLHAAWAARALESGRHVLLEKSLTAGYADARRLVELAERGGLVLAENFVFLRHPQHARVRELLAAGAVGELRHLTAVFTIPRRPADDIRYSAGLGGGALLDTGAYTVRAARLFLGDGLTVAGAHLRHGGGVDLGGAALLHDAAGVTAQLRFGLDDAYRCAYELTGSTGRITVERAFTCPADRHPVLAVESGGELRTEVLEPADHFARTVAAFAARVRRGPDLPAQRAGLLGQAALLAAVRERAGAPAAAGR